MAETVQHNRTTQLDHVTDAIMQYATVSHELRLGLSDENVPPWVKRMAWQLIEWCDDESRSLVRSIE